MTVSRLVVAQGWGGEGRKRTSFYRVALER